MPNIAIIGGGPTGITLSRSLVSKGFKVDLLEAGTVDSESPELTRESYVFQTQSLIPAGVHKLGGGSNFWIGRIGEFLPLDFSELKGVRPQSFPISYEDLKEFYQEAFGMLTGQIVLDGELVRKESGRLNLSLPPNLQLRIIRYGNKGFFRDSLNLLQGNPRFTLLLGHKCLRITKSTQSSTHESYEILCKVQDKTLTKRYNLVIICCGAMQSPALILNSPSVQDPISSNLIGSFLMEHFDGFAGEIYWDRRLHSGNLKKLLLNKNRETRNSGGLGLAIKVSEALRERHPSINLHLEVIPRQRFYVFDPAKDFRFRRLFSFFYLIERIYKKTFSILSSVILSLRGKATYSVWVKAEILPYKDSRISLDEDGVRVNYSHIVSQKSKLEFVRALQILSEELSKARVGEFRIKTSILEGTDNLFQGHNWHPMGTLKMGSSPANGVVDSNLQLFGSEGVFVADASVFPSGSNGNPTFTAIALGLRLSSHLQKRYS